MHTVRLQCRGAPAPARGSVTARLSQPQQRVHRPCTQRVPHKRLSPVAASEFEPSDAASSPASSSSSSSSSSGPSPYTPSTFQAGSSNGATPLTPAPSTSSSASSTPATTPSVSTYAAASNESPAPAGASGVSRTSGSSNRGSSGGATSSPRKIQYLKSRLLATVASLDRGLAANAREAKEVEDLCSQLEMLGGRVDLQTRIPGDVDYSYSPGDEPSGGAAGKLPGMWRLVYTSGFNTGSLGGRRPGPPAALVPTTLGQVYQRIDAATGKLDNIVELLFTTGLPDLGAALLGAAQPRRDTPAVRLTLGHDYEIQGESTVQIVYEDTSAELVGSSLFRNLPRFDVPNLPEVLRPPKFLRSAKFEVVFLDDEMRVTRGDRSELRVYLRERDDVMDLQTPGAAAWSSVDEDE